MTGEYLLSAGKRGRVRAFSSGGDLRRLRPATRFLLFSQSAPTGSALAEPSPRPSPTGRGGGFSPLGRLSAQDGLIAGALALLVLATRLPFRTHYLYNWDSGNFALALGRFDVTAHQPHPPGYFYYVGTGRLLNAWLGDANASLVWISVLFSALAVATLYLCGRAMFDRATGLIAALFLAFSVTYWGYGGVALTYVCLAFFSALVAWLAHAVGFRGQRRMIPLTLAYVVASGYRPDLLLFLGPLWLFAWWRVPWRARLVSFGLAVLGFAVWFVPTVWLSGGLNAYGQTFYNYIWGDLRDRYTVLSPQGGQALWRNLRDWTSYVYYALYAALIPLGFGLAWALRRGYWRSRLGLFCALWVVPTLLFYSFIHIGDPGYVFSIVPALLLIAARFLALVSRAARARGLGAPARRSNPGRWLLLALVAGVVVVNASIFLFRPNTLTASGFRQADRALAAKIDYLQGHYPADTTMVVSYDSYRQLSYYLPDYWHVWADITDPTTRQVVVKPHIRHVVLIDTTVEESPPVPDGRERLAVPDDLVFEHWTVQGNETLVYGGKHVTLQR